MQFDVGARRGGRIESLDGLFDGREVFGKVAHRERLKLRVGRNRRALETAEKWPQYSGQVVHIAVINRKNLTLKALLGDEIVFGLCLRGWGRLLGRTNAELTISRNQATAVRAFFISLSMKPYLQKFWLDAFGRFVWRTFVGLDGCENQMMRMFGSLVCISTLRVFSEVAEVLERVPSVLLENTWADLLGPRAPARLLGCHDV